MGILETGNLQERCFLPYFIRESKVYEKPKLQRHVYLYFGSALVFEGSHLYLGYQRNISTKCLVGN